jgi:hypothetical protein
MKVKIKTLLIFIFITLTLNGCLQYNPKPKEVTKSFYLNKSLTRFEIDNGYCYAREKSSDGGYINYWRSDRGAPLIDALTWDSFPYCELRIKTNKDSIITKIEVLEDDIKCAWVLK